MIRYLILITLLAMLTACASQSTTVTQNPDTYCRNNGLNTGADEYESCIATRIDSMCVDQGFMQGSAEYKSCQENLRTSVFTRQQLQMRGY